jgi:uncharacterized membrane protein
MKRILLTILFMTLFTDLTILLDIPLREVFVFAFLSFIPGFAVLRLFKLKRTSFLDTFIFSVALSIASVMFIGLLTNKLFLSLGFPQPLTTIPLTITISIFTLIVLFVDYRSTSLETLRLRERFEDKVKNFFPLSIILIILPFLSAISVLLLNVPLILLSCAIIAALCIMSAVSRRLVPENLFPFLIFSISMALICQVPLLSKYLMGWDVNLEFYVFRITQINGQWGFLNADVNSFVTLTFDSMLSVTLLPAIYSVLMHAQGEIVFKVLYPFIISLIPLTLYRIFEKQFGKMIGLLSTFFFIFTSVAFFGSEILSVNRQIVGEFLLLLSIFLLINKTIPVTKRRLLLIIFGAALAVSHYSLAYIYLAIIVLVFVVSKMRPKFNDSLNPISFLLLFGVVFLWYTLTYAPLESLNFTVRRTLAQLMGTLPTTGATASTMYVVPNTFTVASWINLFVLGIADLFLILGVVVIILRPKITGIFERFRIISIIGAIILAVSLVVPSIAIILNYSRILGITLLFLAPCFVFGGKTLLTLPGKVWKKIKRSSKCQSSLRNKNIDIVFLLIAILLGAYFLSQVGFINRVTNGSISNYYSTNFDRMLTSNETQVKINLYDSYIPEQDVYSGSWLQKYRVEPTEVFADSGSGSHVLVSYGLVPNNLILPLINSTVPPQGSFIYFGNLNIVDGVISTNTGLFNTSEIASLLNQNNLIYSNGDSEIRCVVPVK